MLGRCIHCYSRLVNSQLIFSSPTPLAPLGITTLAPSARYRALLLKPARDHVAYHSSSTAMLTPKRGRQTTETPCNVVISPPSTVTRLPLAPEGKAEVETFARSLSWEQYKPQFHTKMQLLGIRVPARDAGKVVKMAELKDFVLAAARVKPIIQDTLSEPSLRTIRLKNSNQDELSQPLRDLVAQHSEWSFVPAEVTLHHDYFSSEVILKALLPESLAEGAPTAFTMVGHIAHINLRSEYLPYKYIIGQIMLESSPTIRTVVNKLDSIDAEFRFFEMEKLAGEDDFIAETSESNCTFTFDFRSVYWNSRLHTEHARLVESFRPYDVVIDVMAGVGPFAIPAGKRGCWVYANDLNPSSANSLRNNRERNKVQERLRAADCVDGRDFIRKVPARVWKEACEGGWVGLDADSAWEAETKIRKLKAKEALQARLAAVNTAKGQTGSASEPRSQADQQLVESLRQRRLPRRLPDHFVMNLPASALEFLDAFRGAYAELLHAVGKESILSEVERRHASADIYEGQPWPMVHVHCFTKEVENAHEDICERANQSLGLTGTSRLTPPPMTGQEPKGTPTTDVSLHFVRAVAPNKDMYCLSFRLTPEILFPAAESQSERA